MRTPKILFIDLETAPNLGYTWGKHEQEVIDFKQGWYILCLAYKWLGEKTIHSKALPDYKREWKKDNTDDYELVKDLWKLFDEAEVIVGHNGDNFDIKKSNQRFIAHRLGPPSPYRSYDTLKAARRIASNNSNKLDDLGAVYHLGRKLPHTGKHLWFGCMEKEVNKKAWHTMREYNKQDVALLEKLYLTLRPWDKSHPNLTLLTGRLTSCPRCGSQRIQMRGEKYNSTVGTYQHYYCLDCQAWPKGNRVGPTAILR